MQQEFLDAREQFISQWGAMGSTWGINRTMAQIHALLLVSPEPLSTDQIMSELRISRGNANSNLRELVGWGLIHSVARRGERKEYFQAVKEVWRIFCIIARERKRREIEPALSLLRNCAERSQNTGSEEAKTFHAQVTALADFVETANQVLDKIAQSEESNVVPKVLKVLT